MSLEKQYDNAEMLQQAGDLVNKNEVGDTQAAEATDDFMKYEGWVSDEVNNNEIDAIVTQYSSRIDKRIWKYTSGEVIKSQLDERDSWVKKWIFNQDEANLYIKLKTQSDSGKKMYPVDKVLLQLLEEYQQSFVHDVNEKIKEEFEKNANLFASMWKSKLDSYTNAQDRKEENVTYICAETTEKNDKDWALQKITDPEIIKRGIVWWYINERWGYDRYQVPPVPISYWTDKMQDNLGGNDNTRRIAYSIADEVFKDHKRLDLAVVVDKAKQQWASSQITTFKKQS